MKKILGLVIALVAFTGAFAQCNLTVTNNTAANIGFDAVEATAYDCQAQADGVFGLAVAANSSTTVSHIQYTNWIGIQLTSIGGTAVVEGFPNNLATNCGAGSGTFTVTWVSACQVVIN